MNFLAGYGPIGMLFALGFLFAGAVMMNIFDAAHKVKMWRHNTSQEGWSWGFFTLNMVGATVALPMAMLMVWGGFFSDISYLVTDYPSAGNWLCAVTIRFSGFLVFFGTGLYPLALEVDSFLGKAKAAIGSRKAKSLST